MKKSPNFNPARMQNYTAHKMPRQIIIRGLVPRTLPHELQKALSEICPFLDITIIEVKCKNGTCKSKNAILFPPTIKMFDSLRRARITLHGRMLICEPLFKKEEAYLEELEQKKKVFLKKIPRSTSDNQLYFELECIGPVEHAYCIKKKGKSNGYGFVKFEDQATAQKLIDAGQVFINGEMVLCHSFTKETGSISPSTNEQQNSPENQNNPVSLRCTEIIRNSSFNHRAKNIRINKPDLQYQQSRYMDNFHRQDQHFMN